MIGAKCRFDNELGKLTERYGTIIAKILTPKPQFIIKVESKESYKFMLLSNCGDYLQNKYELIEKYGDMRVAFREKKYIEIAKYFPNLDIFKKLYPSGQVDGRFWRVD